MISAGIYSDLPQQIESLYVKEDNQVRFLILGTFCFITYLIIQSPAKFSEVYCLIFDLKFTYRDISSVSYVFCTQYMKNETAETKENYTAIIRK